jgi:hypothetical protein
MTIAFTITPKELERQAGLAFVGLAYRVSLHYKQDTVLTDASTVAAWDAVKVATANGYADVTGTIAAGAYNVSTGRFELPVIQALFSSTGAGYSYDSVLIRIGSATYPHSIGLFTEQQVLQSGQEQTFTLLLANDN